MRSPFKTTRTFRAPFHFVLSRSSSNNNEKIERAVLWWPCICRCPGATAIELTWLLEVAAPLCDLSPPLDEPAPRYDPAADTVLSWHEVSCQSVRNLASAHAVHHVFQLQERHWMCCSMADALLVDICSEH